MATSNADYPVKFDIKYTDQQNRLTTLFRILLSIPILILISLLTSDFTSEASKDTSTSGGSIMFGLFAAIALMILFRQRYPRWWFDFYLELKRFSARVGSYLFLLTDRYPSTTDKQAVTLDIKYPDAQKELSRWLPLVKWFLAIPHYIVLLVLIVAAAVSTVIAWFAILITGRYPKSLFDFVVGVGRWSTRVDAYAFMLATDTYPPFSLK